MRKLIQIALAMAAIAGVTFTFGQTASTGTATWSWTAPTSYTNGSPLSPSDASGMTYNVYTGPGQGQESTTATATGVAALTYQTSGYAAGSTVCGYIEAVLPDGVSSGPSSEACKTFPVAAPLVPAAPSSLKVQ